MKKSLFVILLVTAISSTAFAETTDTDTSTATTNPSVTSNQAQNDGAIIASVMVIDEGEIAAAKEALKRKVDPLVKGFAELMIKQHGENLKQATELSQKIKIKPDTAAAASLKDQGEKDLTQLKSLNDKDFQKSYIDAMVKGHTDALNMLKNTIPQVQNPKLKSFLEATQKVVETHLEKAQAIQSKLSS